MITAPVFREKQQHFFKSIMMEQTLERAPAWTKELQDTICTERSAGSNNMIIVEDPILVGSLCLFWDEFALYPANNIAPSVCWQYSVRASKKYGLHKRSRTLLFKVMRTLS